MSLRWLLVAALLALLAGALAQEDSGAAGGSGETETDDSEAIVAKLIQNVLAGKPADMRGITQPGSTMALGNQNTINRDLPKVDLGAGEEKVKKTATLGKKAHEEQVTKMDMEEAFKLKQLEKEKAKIEMRAKQFDDELRRRDEQQTKRGNEEMAKQEEEASKQIEQMKRQQRATLLKDKREEELEKAKQVTQESAAKAGNEMDRKKSDEAIRKQQVQKEHERDLADAKAKQQAEEKTKAAEAQDKKEAEQATKKKAEQAEKSKKAEEERRKRNDPGKTCQCQTVSANWQSYNLWITCPSGYLFHGLYRNGHNMLNGIQYYQCCKPCDADGRVQSVGSCQTANWVGSFDSYGTSYCPGNQFVQGFYKSSCDWIYCLEYANCCSIGRGSVQYDNCGTANWWGALDGAGWATNANNKFARGLMRNSCHWLHCVEESPECGWKGQ